MIPKECKRLAEVDFPIAEVSKHAVRDNANRRGHPWKLHKWWARRPLASSRAVLLALLLPDPCDEHCPEEFKRKARRILISFAPGPATWVTTIRSDTGLRQIILKFIADFANRDNAANSHYLETGRALVKAAHGEVPPMVADPFSGGGSIPLEALRLGCEAFASDLNPVACLILKVMLEDIPRQGSGLAEELRKIGVEIQEKLEKDLADLYPIDPDGAVPISYLWARTVQCEAPNCGAEIPLMRSFWLCEKAKRKRALRHRVERCAGELPSVEFEIFEPKADSAVRGATMSHAKAVCLCCSAVLPPERVRAQLVDQRGGADVIFDAEGQRTGGARMTAVVTQRSGEKGRHYRLPTDMDYAVVRMAQKRVAQVLETWEQGEKEGLCPVPDEPLPPIGTLGFRVQRYGMMEWGDLFTARQKAAITMLTSQVRGIVLSGDRSIHNMLALAFGKLFRHCNVLSKWHRGSETVAGAFGMQSLPMSWDFPEMYPMVDYAGGIKNCVEDIACSAQEIALGTSALRLGQAEIANSVEHPLPDATAEVWFTDPPYYDAIPYSDLSDFFFVWLKRMLPDNSLLRDPFDPDNLLSPKTAEAVQDETKRVNGNPKNREWFEEIMAQAFAEGRRILREDGIGSVVFAHKTTEGWEALLSGMIRGGWTITGSWPITTERGARLRARDSAALATSVHLICRPRSEDAPIGDWADVLRELPVRVTDWIERLQGEGIRGADLVFACIGPALEIFSRYRAVETAEGNIIGLSDYLEKVWEVVGRVALQQVLGTAEAQAHNGVSGALEEDARLTALFLWTLQSTETVEKGAAEGGDALPSKTDAETVSKVAAKGFSLPFDVVRRFAQPMGIDLDAWNGRIIDQKKGIVRLLPVSERAQNLFGQDGATAIADYMERDPQESSQQTLFPNLQDAPSNIVREPRARYNVSSDESLAETMGGTNLDRVHTAMLLQSGGHANALRTLIAAEQDRGPDFLRLANSLSALYPTGCNEKRLLDAMLLAVPNRTS